MTDSDQAWVHYGRTDPYHGVLTKDAFTADRFDDDARAEFFRTGEDYVDHVLGLARQHLDPSLTIGRVLDFGCGVGRLTLPWARRAESAVGVDISPGMLDEARSNAEAAGLTNATFVRSDDELTRAIGPFDLVHSFIVFQHIAPHRGLAILERMIDRLAPDGVGIVQLTYANALSTPRTRRLLTTAYERIPFVHELRNVVRRRPLREPQMHMNRYDLNGVFRLLQETGCHEAVVRFTEASHYHHPIYGVLVLFRKRTLDTETFS